MEIPELQREIRAVLESESFRQAPKLCSLLRYVCEKALLNEAERVTEYTIAVDVFGKPSTFKESKDSHVRVEVHRLRKRLTHFYESEGATRPLRIVIPPGRYTPEFVPADLPGEPPATTSITASQPEEAVAPLPEQVPEEASEAPRIDFEDPRDVNLPSTRRRTLYALISASLAAALILGLWLSKTSWRRAPIRAVPASTALSSAEPRRSGQRDAPAPSSPGAAPIRVLAGYNGPVHVDGTGAVWESDRYFQGGRPGTRRTAATARTNDPVLFQNSRIGDFSYDIPLIPGRYEVHLYFVEPAYGPEFGRGENDRTFFLHINEQRVTPALDIESDAMGANIADERVFKDVEPASDGKLHLGFESGTGVPTVNAIEVLPGLPNRQLPIRIVSQSVPFTDHAGQRWQRDSYYMNGQTCPREQPVAGTSDPGLFAMERYGHFTYAIPVDVNGRYTVILHFAEFYFGPSAPGHGGIGSRVFNVMCNGVLLLDHLDIFKEAGTAHALTKTFHHLKPSAQGKLNLTFEPVVNYALIDGIEVIGEAE